MRNSKKTTVSLEFKKWVVYDPVNVLRIEINKDLIILFYFILTKIELGLITVSVCTLQIFPTFCVEQREVKLIIFRKNPLTPTKTKSEGGEVAIIVMLADGGIRDGASFNDSLQDALSASHIVVSYLSICVSPVFFYFSVSLNTFLSLRQSCVCWCICKSFFTLFLCISFPKPFVHSIAYCTI
jgi:hypothetical protein